MEVVTSYGGWRPWGLSWASEDGVMQRPDRVRVRTRRPFQAEEWGLQGVSTATEAEEKRAWR